MKKKTLKGFMKRKLAAKKILKKSERPTLIMKQSPLVNLYFEEGRYENG